MSVSLLTGNGAAAWAARMAEVDYIPAFPITPQTEIIETLAGWTEAGEMDGRLVTLESEHSMIAAAGAAAATGVRVFSATSSQGLLYAMEMLYTVTGWRAPFVLVNVSRGVAAPVTLESDHNDILAARDCGFLQIHCATCQEVFDAVLLAYRLGEDPRIRLPVLVNLDGFYLSFTREPVELPSPEMVRGFLPSFDPQHIRFTASNPESQAVAVLGGGPYSYFRYQVHLAMMNGLAVFEEIADDFEAAFGRRLHAVESYRADDAEIVFFMVGSFATKAKDAVDQLRKAGHKVGLVRPRLLRPFPADAICEQLAGTQGVAVIDQNISLGKGGVLQMELLSVLYGKPGMPAIVTSFVGGLGGRDISPQEFYEIEAVTRRAIDSGETPPTRLLYTDNELREMRKLQAIARVEQDETSPLKWQRSARAEDAAAGEKGND